ncbi:PREDICTED: uncharacterized protein LOC109362997 isoform X1 [Lupinus angustifolius]|uniref:uncharacterized protein LOC109362997 isoform X1 n=1 Tax=Lupinus angustifolius TaxID=3871 RepID=UPI00092FBDF5|nr:PREDICTED: uncharacterized protein LOC109362997 isoform X1 [Lupinus angustifolius]
MLNTRDNGEIREGVVAVAVDKEKSSQYALRWAVDNLCPRDTPIKLVHVVQNPGVAGNNDMTQQEQETLPSELLLSYRCYCIRRQVQYEIVILNDHDVARALINYVSQGGIDTLVLGTSSRNSFSRIFKNSDLTSSVLKWGSEYSKVYIINKGKVSATRSASRSAQSMHAVERIQPVYHNLNQQGDPNMLFDELSVVDNDNSFVSSERHSTDSNCISFYENLGSRLEIGSSSDVLKLEDEKFEPLFSTSEPVNMDTMKDLASHERPSFSIHNQVSIEDEMMRLKLDLERAMDLYHTVCKEALVSKHKLIELQDWKEKQEHRMKEIELENTRCKVTNEAPQRLENQEVEKRLLKAEIRAMIESDEKQKVLDVLRQSHTVIKYQSIFHVFVVLFLSYLYVFSLK